MKITIKFDDFTYALIKRGVDALERIARNTAPPQPEPSSLEVNFGVPQAMTEEVKKEKQ